MFKKLSFQIAHIGVIAMAFSGCSLVLYGIISAVTKSPWPPLEKSAHWISLVATLIATILTAISIYLPTHNRAPMFVSRYFVAPVVVFFGVCSLFYVAYTRALLSEHIVNGFAIIGLSGGLLRLFPRSLE